MQEAAALGLTRSMVQTRLEHGIFVRIGRGVLALPGTATRPDALLRAAGRVLGAVVSHESAARIHGLKPVTEEVPTATVSHRSTHTFGGVRIHQSTDLVEGHVTDHDGLRVTTPERTIVDLAQVLSRKRLERVIDNALASRLVDVVDVALLHESLARKGKPGVAKLRRILSARVGDSVVPLNVLEREVLELISRAGLPEPVKQFHAPWLKQVEGRVDFAYIDQRLVIEADGRRWHALFDAFEVDRRRDNAAQLAGWRILRFTWAMITEEPVETVKTIRQALNTGPNPLS